MIASRPTMATKKTTKKAPPAHHKAIFRHLCEQWTDSVKVVRMTASSTPVKQDIACFVGWPESGLTVYSTIGLSDHGGHELACVSASKNKSFSKVVFDLAEMVIDERRVLKAGVVFEKLVAQYYTRANASSLLISKAAPEGISIPQLKMGRKTVSWLFGWPLTGDEFVARENEGAKVVETALRGLDLAAVANLGRDTAEGVPEFDPWTAPNQGSSA